MESDLELVMLKIYCNVVKRHMFNEWTSMCLENKDGVCPVRARHATVVLPFLTLTPDLPSPREAPQVDQRGLQPSLQGTLHK